MYNWLSPWAELMMPVFMLWTLPPGGQSLTQTDQTFSLVKESQLTSSSSYIQYQIDISIYDKLAVGHISYNFTLV